MSCSVILVLTPTSQLHAVAVCLLRKPAIVKHLVLLNGINECIFATRPICSYSGWSVKNSWVPIVLQYLLLNYALPSRNDIRKEKTDMKECWVALRRDKSGHWNKGRKSQQWDLCADGDLWGHQGCSNCGWLKEGSRNVWILLRRSARDKGSRFYKAVDEDSASVPMY